MGTTLPQTEKAIRASFGSDDLKIFELPRNADFYRAYHELRPQLLAQLEADSEAPSRIILLDVNPSTMVFLRFVHDLIPSRNKLSLVIFAYGNFLCSSELMYQVQPLLLGYEVHWIATSNAQAGVLRSCLKGEATVSICAIPIGDSFSFDADLRTQVRARLKAEPDEILLLYAGRIASEKNVDLLIQLFKKMLEVRPSSRIRILIAGEFDDEDGGLVRGRLPLGFQFKTIFDQYLRQSDPKISLLGKVDRDQLRSYYMAADVAVSMSLFHEEEFGLSVAESRMSGLPLMLTPWGGHLDHPEIEPLAFSDEGGEPFFYLSDILDRMSKLSLRSTTTRMKKSMEARAYLGQEAIAARLTKLFLINPAIFEGFSSNYQLWSQLQVEMKKTESLAVFKNYLEFRSKLMNSYKRQSNE